MCGGEGITIVSGPGGVVRSNPPNSPWLRACIPVKSTDFGGSLPIFLPSYRQPTDLPQSTDFYRFFRGSTEF